jgi:hypothetical protein
MRRLAKADSFHAAVALLAALHVLASLLIAFWGLPTFFVAKPSLGERALLWLGLCLGPLGGWVAAVAQRHLCAALPLLAGASVLCAAPLTVAFVCRSSGALLLSALLWFLCGYCLIIGIWV